MKGEASASPFSINTIMVKPLNSRFFGDDEMDIAVRFHNGTTVVPGRFVKQIGLKRYVVEDEQNNRFTVTLAQTTAEATNLTAGLATVAVQSEFSAPVEYAREIRGNQMITTGGNVVNWRVWTALYSTAPKYTGDAPNILGNPVVGEELSLSYIRTGYGDVAETISWRRNGVEVATTENYTLVGADEGAEITAVLTATSIWGTDVVETAPVGPVATA